MHRPKTFRHRKSSSRVNHRWMFAERLERRSVLCAVSCELTDGTLTVEASEGEDQIAVVMDHHQNAIRVYAGTEEAGLFAANDVQSLRVVGLDATDTISIDQQLALPVEIETADGEAMMDEQTHAAVLAAVTEPEIPTPLFIAEDSATHGHSADSVFATTTNFEPASDHHALSSSSAWSPNVVASDHDHAGATPAIANIATAATTDLLNGTASQRRSESRGAGHHAGAVERKSSTSGDLAPKYCLTTPYTKVIIANVDRKPECDCAKEKKAAPEASALTRFLVTGSDASPKLLVDLDWERVSRANAGAECRPCKDEFLTGVMTDAEICSLRTPTEIVREITAATQREAEQLRLLANAEQSFEGGDLDAVANESAAVWFNDSQLAIAGWTLLASGLALLPFVLSQRQKSKDENQSETELGWTIGGFEILTA